MVIFGNEITLVCTIMTDYSQLVTEIAAIPSISGGRFTSNKTDSIELNLTIRKYSGDVTKKASYLWRGSGPVIDSNTDVKFQSLSPDGSILLIGRSSGEKDRSIEIWSNGGCSFVTSINVKDVIEDFCCDGIISIFCTCINLIHF